MSSYGYASHLLMMRDKVRMDAHARAIRQCVRPGDVVLDLGAAGGVMTFLALEAGAARVHAIDPSHSIELLRKVARENGLLDRIQIYVEDSRLVRLPEQVDVVVADLRGAVPVFAEGISVLRDARARHLKPGGRMIPVADRIILAPVERAEAHESVSGWNETYGGADYSSMSTVAANSYWRNPFDEGALLAPGAPAPEIRYDEAWSGLDAELRFEVTRAGVLHGLGGWFEAELAPGVVLSTAPEHGETVYGQAFFPIRDAIAVAPADEITATLSVRTGGREPIWTWTVRVVSGGRVALDERHCTFDDRIMTLAELRKRGDAYQPRLNLHGRVQKYVLDRMDAGARLGDIARELAERFPERFPDPADALAFAGELSQRFSE